MYLSSSVDEAYEGVRKEYRLYPVMLLYKVLLELGRSTGNYKISLDEYRYFVATTKKFESFLETLLLITLSRQDDSAMELFETYRTKFDNRIIQALKQLKTLVIDKNSISIDDHFVDEVAQKVFVFESNPNTLSEENYIQFLGSTRSLISLDKHGYDLPRDSTGGIMKENNNSDSVAIEESTRLATGENILLYGVPGSGKSWTIEQDYCEDAKRMERLVFHPDYMYSDFVGQILPKVVKGDDGTEKVRYEFTPGPFTKILKRAYQDPTNAYFLVIEEINRGNAPAIFGEIFQLLDRADKDEISEGNVLLRKCTSEYGITNTNIAGVIYGDEDKKIRIPSNLSILGTMNTSDQNVFTLDTAFQRRWIMRMIPNSFKNHEFADTKILDTDVTWKQFCEAINEEILQKNNIMSSEDKRLGAYFVSADDLTLMDIPTTGSSIEKKRAEHHNSRFAEKVLKYLWDDAFKFSHADTFDNKRYKSLEMVIDGFMRGTGSNRFKIFNQSLRSMILDGIDEDDIVSDDEN